MPSFDKKDFEENIRKFRRIKGLSQENLAMVLNKTSATMLDRKMEKLHLTQNKYI